jgi:translation initiation factor 1
MDICPKCGLPKQACVCEEIAKSEQRIQISTVKRSYGKITTIVTGIGKELDIKSVAKQLKTELACGGTVKNGNIELQGQHVKKIKPLLIQLGFPPESIEN